MNAADFLTALVRNSFAAGVLVLLVLAAQRVFRKQLAPRWHCALWLLVIARLLPFSFSSDVSLFNFMPRWGQTSGSDERAPAASAIEFSAVPSMSPPLAAFAPETAPAAAPPVTRAEPSASWIARVKENPATALFCFWLAGVVVLAGCVIHSALALARATARAPAVDDGAVLARLRACCDAMGVRSIPMLVETAAITTPAVHGLVRPRVLLPPGFTAAFSANEQRFVFLHELAHVRRHDLWVNWLVTALQVLHWFNPLVWFAFARWRIDREIACDAAALEAAGPASHRSYGETMLRLLENFALPRRGPGLVGILEDNRQLHRRMKMIADFTPARRPFVAIGLLAILGLIGLTDAQVVPSSPQQARTPLATVKPTSDDLIAEIARRFGGDRRKFLDYLKEQGMTVREYRREVEESLRATAGETAAPRTAVPQPTAPYVLFLVNGSETMLDEFSPSSPTAGAPGENPERGRPYVTRHRTATDGQKRAAPKWQRTLQTLEQMLQALPAETNFHVAVFSDPTIEPVGGRVAPNDTDAIVNTLARLRTTVPQGAANLEAAFEFVAEALRDPAPERIVLLTDGLPTTAFTSPPRGEVTEAQRIHAFQAATRRIPSRIPVHTVLMPAPTADPGAAGLYWQLAHATRGQLTVPAHAASEPRTHLAFVVDTSGSMRDPNNGGLWPIVIATIEATLETQPQLTGLQLLDGDGRFILGRRGSGAAAWLPNTPETRDAIRRALRRYTQDTVSNPLPGVTNAIRFLHDKEDTRMQMGIYVLGDEFNSSDNAGVVLDRIDALNPRDASGRRAITISAVGFPTTIRYQFSMGNTGLRFANLMRMLTADHDGAFIALPEL
jgi:beta-lactamase regulating signal transducer with metallopeptidase domain